MKVQKSYDKSEASRVLRIMRGHGLILVIVPKKPHDQKQRYTFTHSLGDEHAVAIIKGTIKKQKDDKMFRMRMLHGVWT